MAVGRRGFVHFRASTSRLLVPGASAPRLATGPIFWQPAPTLAAAARPYITVVKYQREDVLAKLDDFRAEVFSTNWADYLNLVYNVPFWESELDKLTSIVQPYLHEPEVGAKFGEVQELMDVL
eukprot:CAMPEP_0183428156 /NCGR_PEP_ID=MMETSP0370-20130417/44236_1 /TAXON_ID=268820 /ORGANISM="Peridinium aciculiferum, Strain PAER-2" /LENGTH=122 /DNA_ID=CAMNT_0025612883 /DNA_START=54 /DNA_END=418 /DNA_ORIENTATION=-